MGDPAGVGPELCLRAMAHADVTAICTPILFGDLAVLERVAECCALPVPGEVVPCDDWDGVAPAGPLLVDCAAIDGKTVVPGKVQAACGKASYTYIREAIQAVQRDWTEAIVTAPIHKAALQRGGVPFPGHTEMLAAHTHTTDYCMMLGSEAISVSLVTTHTALANVPAGITMARILTVIELTADALRRRGRPHPRLTVCGLNPHAGEQGLFGREEATTIEPAVAMARERGHMVVGPLPPDTAFVPARRAETDAYIVMYHDQGLIPFKMLAFDEGVNITLGLPIVRTSVDHGTAFDIAWQGQASPGSLLHAIRWAVDLRVPQRAKACSHRPEGRQEDRDPAALSRADGRDPVAVGNGGIVNPAIVPPGHSC
jgi:4-phospho-D-threonate 3-dehydrogenase / 4-phospho-D-erythronate 3-dehydrogenase